MERVTVKRDELLGIIQANREAHTAIFDEAVVGYKDTVLKELERHIEQVRAGKVRHVQVNLPMPENHVKDYDRAIKMVQMSVGDTIVLSEHDFQSYVMDDWQWKRQFLTSNSTYSLAATQSLKEL